MTTIRLLDARLGLNRKCEELFKDAKIAEAIYQYLCDGIDDCEDVAHERKRGTWTKIGDHAYRCSVCNDVSCCMGDYCPNCGAEMRGEEDGS